MSRSGSVSQGQRSDAPAHSHSDGRWAHVGADSFARGRPSPRRCQCPPPPNPGNAPVGQHLYHSEPVAVAAPGVASWASRLSRWPRWKNGKSRSRSSALSHCCCRRGQRIGLLPSEQLDPRLRFEGTPVPEGHRVAPKYSAEFDDQLARLSVRAATESHFDIVGVERFVVNEITRRLRRDVEQRQRPRAAMMSVRANIRGTTMGPDVFLGALRSKNFHGASVPS